MHANLFLKGEVGPMKLCNSANGFGVEIYLPDEDNFWFKGRRSSLNS